MNATGLATRLEEIPGVATVVVDLTESGGGINVRLEPGADEDRVMERLRSLLVAYGVRSPGPPPIPEPDDDPSAGLTESRRVDARITPIEAGARVEVSTKNVKSFRVVAATPSAIAQGLTDAWCQVIGRVPVEVTGISSGESGHLQLSITDGERDVAVSASLDDGWEAALTTAVRRALRETSDPATPTRLGAG